MLTISSFHTDYYVPETYSDRLLLQKKMDRLVSQRLETDLAERFEMLPGDEDAVYRIRKLELDIWIGALNAPDGVISRRWSTLILREVVNVLLYGSPGDVVRFDDHAHFVASFLADLSDGRAWSRWVYDEFSPLRDLPLGQVVAHLLAPRPTLLLPVVSRLKGMGRLEAVLQSLQPADVRLIWERGLGFGTAPPSVLDDFPRDLSFDAVLEQGDAAAEARNRLRLYLAAAASRPNHAVDARLAGLCIHLARLYRAYSLAPAPILWAALKRKEIDGPAALSAVLKRLPDTLREWLTVALATKKGRDYLADLVALIIPESKTDDAKASGTPRLHRVATSFAGLSLLLPEIRALGLYEMVGNAGLYRLLLALVDRKYRPLARSDAAPALLSGLPDYQKERALTAAIDWPDPASLLEGFTPDRDEKKPEEALAEVLLRRFAQGLRGFEKSSPAFLFDRFIYQPGHIHWSDEMVAVHFSRLPLGILLSMSGRTGDQGAIPWLHDRRLELHLP